VLFLAFALCAGFNQSAGVLQVFWAAALGGGHTSYLFTPIDASASGEVL
jgi:hypothetical protein